MGAPLKLLVGLVATLIAAWISHGPLGRGETYVADLEARATAAVRESELPGVTVRIQREPMMWRQAILSGPANDFQREGMGLLPGLNDRVLAVAGVASLRWEESACCAQDGGDNAAAVR
ncbi:MAG: hypothetical protein ACT4OE_05285 [Sphingosinicella sp.]